MEKKEEHLETENVANRSLGRRKATSIHNTNKITTTTTTTPTKTTTTAESSHSSFPSLAASGLQIDSESILPTLKTDLSSVSPSHEKKERKKERRVQNEIKIKKKKRKKNALFCFRRSNLHN